MLEMEPERIIEQVDKSVAVYPLPTIAPIKCPVRISPRDPPVFAPHLSIKIEGASIGPTPDEDPHTVTLMHKEMAETLAFQSQDEWYGLWMHNAPGYAPSKAPGLLWGVFTYRLCVSPASHLAPLGEPPIDFGRPWAGASKLYCRILRRRVEVLGFGPLDRTEERVTQWLDNLEDAPKRKIMAQCLERVSSGRITTIPITKIMVKRDEKLFKRNKDGKMDILPRPIANVSPLVQADVGPCTAECSKRSKLAWAWDWWNREPDLEMMVMGELVPVWLCNMSGATDVQMSESITNASRHYGHLLLWAAGDDTLADFSGMKQSIVDSGDFSKFDRSQGAAALLAGNQALRVLGASDDDIHTLTMMQHATYIFTDVKNPTMVFKLYRKQDPFRDTGGPNTTISNTDVALTATLEVHRNLTAWEDKTSRYAQLGLDFKSRSARGPERFRCADFLKNVFVPSTDACYLAVPIMGRLLKMGSSRRHPQELFKGDQATAANAFLRSVADGVAGAWLDPPTRAMVAKWQSLSLSPRRVAATVEPWKVSAAAWDTPFLQGIKSDYEPDWEAWYEQTAWRYGVPVAQVQHFCEFIQASPTTGFLCHPMFEVMARVDYG